jgi:hypothetical protein
VSIYKIDIIPIHLSEEKRYQGGLDITKTKAKEGLGLFSLEKKEVN